MLVLWPSNAALWPSSIGHRATSSFILVLDKEEYQIGAGNCLFNCDSRVYKSVHWTNYKFGPSPPKKSWYNFQADGAKESIICT